MRVAVISGQFFETTIPLVKAFADAAHTVDFYAVCANGRQFNNSPSFEYERLFKGYFLVEASPSDIRGMKDLASDNLKIYLCKYNFFDKESKVVKAINSLFWPFLLSRLVKKLKNNQYDFILVIGHYYFLYELSILLNTTGIKHTHTLHEVIDHSGSGKVYSFLDYLLKENVHIILHSKHLMEQLSALGYDESCISVIPFGPCIGYKDFNENEKSISDLIGDCRYFLSYGYISKYKGYQLLWNSYQILKNDGPLPFKIVVAGYGFDEYVEKMKNNSDFIVINKFISNDELVTLISRSEAVLCPYSSVSQSGIPQTCMVWNTPVIATKIGAFKEVLSETGVLADSDASKYAESMKFVFETRYKPSIIPHDFQWNTIIRCYEDVYNNQKINKRNVRNCNAFQLFVNDILNKHRNKNNIGGK